MRIGIRLMTALAMLTIMLTGFLAAAQETSSAAAQSDQPADSGRGFAWTIDAVAGVEAVTGDTASSKFQEYRELPHGLFLESLRVCGEEPGGHYVKLSVDDLAQRDEEGILSGGRWGQYSGYLSLDKIPHWLSNTSELIFQRSGSVYTLPDAVRAAFETAAAATPADRAAFQALVDGLAKPFPLRFDRETWALGGSHDIAGRIDYSVEVSDEHRQGTEPIGTTFSFTNQVELPEPIDYHTTDVNAGAQYQANWGALQVSYWGQFFDNSNPALTWDNPIRVGDSASGSSRGQLALPPDNSSHTVTLSGAVNLPKRSRLVLSLSGARWEQDQALLPPTVNTALTVEPLPVSSANLRIDTFMGNVLFSSKFTDKVSFAAGYRRYRMQDKRPSLEFQQVATDTSVEDFEDIAETPADFTVDNLKVDLDYGVTPDLSLNLGWDRDVWHRKRRNVDRSAETTFRLGANYFLAETLSLRAYYRARDRNISPYQPLTEEQLPLLRKYSQAARDGREAGTILQFTPNERWQADLAWNLVQNDYDALFGILNQNLSDISLDVAYAVSPEANAYFGVARERDHSHLLSRYRPFDNATGEAIDDPLNDWFSFQRDRNWTYWLGYNRVFVPQKWEGDVSVSYTDGRGLVDAAGLPGGASQAQAQNWPETKFQYLALELFAYRRMDKNLKLRFGYRFENYRERDFAQDLMRPYMGFVDSGSATSVYLGARQPGYHAHVFSLAAQAAF